MTREEWKELHSLVRSIGSIALTALKRSQTLRDVQKAIDYGWLERMNKDELAWRARHFPHMPLSQRKDWLKK